MLSCLSHAPIMAACGAYMESWSREGRNFTSKETRDYTQNSLPAPKKLSLWSMGKRRLKEGQGFTQSQQEREGAGHLQGERSQAAFAVRL